MPKRQPCPHTARNTLVCPEDPGAPSLLEPLPRHLAIIMDGNGRWAKQKGLSRSQGHKAGVETARKIVTKCRELGIKHLTLYTFSKENWKRPAEEVGYLFKLLSHFLNKEFASLAEQDIRLTVLGEIEGIPAPTRQALQKACANSEQNRSMRLNLALNYSSRDEIALACRKLMEKGLSSADCTPEALGAELYTAGQPDPDLLIRTSGECRISNFMLFQCAYSEFYFTDTLWPDFNEQELLVALQDFSKRQRRFGATGE